MTDQPTPDPDAIDSATQVLNGTEEDVWVDTDQTPELIDDEEQDQ